MTPALALRRLFQASLFCFALFVPFSIAGMTIAFGFGALSWLLSGAAALAAGLRPRDAAVPFHRDPLLLAAVVLVVSAIPSVLMSENYSRAMTDWASYWELLILFLVARNAIALGMRERLFGAVVVAGALSAIVGIVQRAGGLDAGFIHIGAQYRVSSTLYTMTFAGILYQLIVMNLSVLFVRGMRIWPRVLLAAATGLEFVALLFTMTRGAWLALVAGLVALALMVRGRVALAMGGVLVVALVGVSLISSNVQQGRSVPELLRSGLDRDAATRVVLWDIAWDLFREHPWLGVGMGDYTTEANELLQGRQVTTTVDSHNMYLQILATRGLVGFVPFLAFWVVLFRLLFGLRHRLPKGSLDRQYATGAIAAAVAVLVGGLTELNLDDGEVLMAFTFLLGIGLARYYAPESASTKIAEVGVPRVRASSQE